MVMRKTGSAGDNDNEGVTEVDRDERPNQRTASVERELTDQDRRDIVDGKE